MLPFVLLIILDLVQIPSSALGRGVCTTDGQEVIFGILARLEEGTPMPLCKVCEGVALPCTSLLKGGGKAVILHRREHTPRSSLLRPC